MHFFLFNFVFHYLCDTIHNIVQMKEIFSIMFIHNVMIVVILLFLLVAVMPFTFNLNSYLNSYKTAMLLKVLKGNPCICCVNNPHISIISTCHHLLAVGL